MATNPAVVSGKRRPAPLPHSSESCAGAGSSSASGLRARGRLVPARAADGLAAARGRDAGDVRRPEVDLRACSTPCSTSAAAHRSTSCSPGSSRIPEAVSSGCGSSRRSSRRPRSRRRAARRRGSPAARPDLAATVLCSASWMLLFHGVYGRMYSLFLFTSALSFLALLTPTEKRTRRAWALWAIATLLCVAAHPYGAIVLATQGAYVVVTRVPLRVVVPAFATVLILGTPFWRTDLVLAGPVRRRRRQRLDDPRQPGVDRVLPRDRRGRLHLGLHAGDHGRPAPRTRRLPQPRRGESPAGPCSSRRSSSSRSSR